LSSFASNLHSPLLWKQRSPFAEMALSFFSWLHLPNLYETAEVLRIPLSGKNGFFTGLPFLFLCPSLAVPGPPPISSVFFSNTFYCVTGKGVHLTLTPFFPVAMLF